MSVPCWELVLYRRTAIIYVLHWGTAIISIMT